MKFARFVCLRIFTTAVDVSAGMEAHASILPQHFSPESPMAREI